MPPKQSQKQKQKQTVKQSVVVKIGDVSKKRRRRATAKRPAQQPQQQLPPRPMIQPVYPSYPQSAVFQGQGAYVVPPIQPLAGQAVGAIRPEPPRQGQVRIPVKAEPKEVQTEPVDVAPKGKVDEFAKEAFERGRQYEAYEAMKPQLPVDYGRIIRGDVEGMMAKGLNPMTGLPIGAAIREEPRALSTFDMPPAEVVIDIAPEDLTETPDIPMTQEEIERETNRIRVKEEPLFTPPANLDQPPEQRVPRPIGGSVIQDPRMNAPQRPKIESRFERSGDFGEVIYDKQEKKYITEQEMNAILKVPKISLKLPKKK